MQINNNGNTNKMIMITIKKTTMIKLMIRIITAIVILITIIIRFKVKKIYIHDDENPTAKNYINATATISTNSYIDNYMDNKNQDTTRTELLKDLVNISKIKFKYKVNIE